MKRSFIYAFLLAFGLAAQALPQTPTLVRDINPGMGAPGVAGSHPRQLTTLANRVVFFTRGEDSSYSLWATDGTAAGTEALTVLCVAEPFCREPRRIGQLPGLAFFVAPSPEDPFGLLRVWRTDGTRAGTFPLSPPLVLGDSGSPVVTAALGRHLLFTACEDFSGSNCALWRTDGTVAGTGRVLEGFLSFFGVASNGRRAVFAGRDATGFGVWVTDGTETGTELLLRGGGSFLTASGSKIFFMSGGEEYPTDLWVSDGTKQGSWLIAKFGEPFHRLPPNTTFLKPVPGGVIFVAAKPRGGLNLWRSDGTRNGTRALTAFQESSSLFISSLREDQIAVVRDRVFFIVTGTPGPRLWTSRGSPGTAGPVPGSPALLADSPLSVAGNRVVFAAQDAAHGVEPWTSDGTRPGTRLLRDLCPGPCGSNPYGFTPHLGITDFQATWNGRTRFVRTDGVNAVPLATVAPLPPAQPFDRLPRPRMDLADLDGRTFFAGLDPFQGEQPWVTDGTRPGTRMIAALEESGGSSNPRSFLALGNQLLDRLLFVANDGTEHAIWRISPSGDLSRLAGTGVPAGDMGPSELTESGLYAYYVVDRGRDEELWRTDGTPAGTVRLASFQDKTLSNLRGLGNRLLFLVSSTTGEQPVHSFWQSDGTPAGTAESFDLPTDTVAVTDVAAVGAELYFLLRREGVLQIFRSDGTAAGTRRVLQLLCDCVFSPMTYLRFRGSVYFNALGNQGAAIFRTDGTAEGTVQVIPAPGDPAPQGQEPQALFEYRNELYFFARPPGQPPTEPFWVLWKSNGNDAVLVKDVGFRSFDRIDPQFAAEPGGPLYFRAWDPEHGLELWKTDGTATGTGLVADIEPGPSSSDPRDLVATGGRVWFSAVDRVHGRELWTSDGNVSGGAGTRLVFDLAPGGASSSPEELTPFAGKLFFSADNQVVGREPWSLMILNP